MMDTVASHDTMTAEEVRDALNSVSKNNFNEFESTEWSIVFDQSAGTARSPSCNGEVGAWDSEYYFAPE